MAQEPINIMQLYADVKFYLRHGITERTDFIGLGFERLIALATQIFEPPRSPTSDLRWLGWLDQNIDFFKRRLDWVASS